MKSWWFVGALLMVGCGEKVHEVRVEVTEQGFVPNELKLARGKPTRLMVTRKTDQTCAKEFVLDEPAIHKPLPLGEAVAIDLVPAKAGVLVFGCGMDKMINGRLVVE